MTRIISVSYDETLLRTRHLLLEQGGYEVASAIGFLEAMEMCRTAADLAVIGHSISEKDKLNIIRCFREASPRGLVIALTRAGEKRLKQVDAYINPGDPEELLRAVKFLLSTQPGGRHWNVRPIR
jgi:DNA-binding response OmpR family regulator